MNITFHVLHYMANTSLPFKAPYQKTQTCTPQEKDQESVVLLALGNLERKLDLLHELLLQSDSEQEDGLESQDDEES